MKRYNLVIFGIVTLSVFLVGTSSNSKLDQGKTSYLANFEFTIQKTESGVNLTCSEGCAWKTLSWGRPNQAHIQKVDEYGMVADSNENSRKDSDLADFLLTIQKTDDDVDLTCSKGCAWKELSYSGFKANHVQKINEYGMVTDSTKR